TFWAWAMELAGELGGQKAPESVPEPLPLDVGKAARLAGNTTIGIVATNVRLTKAQAQRIAIMAQDGIARAVRPVHTPFDGDTIFVVSTGRAELGEPSPLQLSRLGTLAADCVTRAICRGVYEAESLGEIKAYRG
ncbi:MAG: P1 family peptidase, partial [Alphaproteobacteria bacterium]|nr:P1 family peptidase [Alphaproteobacteria bacterium]